MNQTSRTNLGSPQPVRRNESLRPVPSRWPYDPCQMKERSVNEADIDRRRCQDGSVSSSSANKASGDEEVQKPRQQASDRPVWVDLVAKHTESLFSFITKSDDDDS
ncbi:hypothetical protein DPMN_095950 [Dreissena polymorpha]|uniref:Uncharacterized protein n=1 Tax=Dreissena polymorpha TaxID=45954 RepID=A0A9D4R4B3_DREPO|nr:hypothetical protein DPMN_095950 [Dreissena polymorpha]